MKNRVTLLIGVAALALSACGKKPSDGNAGPVVPGDPSNFVVQRDLSEAEFRRLQQDLMPSSCQSTPGRQIPREVTVGSESVIETLDQGLVVRERIRVVEKSRIRYVVAKEILGSSLVVANYSGPFYPQSSIQKVCAADSMRDGRGRGPVVATQWRCNEPEHQPLREAWVAMQRGSVTKALGNCRIDELDAQDRDRDDRRDRRDRRRDRSSVVYRSGSFTLADGRSVPALYSQTTRPARLHCRRGGPDADQVFNITTVSIEARGFLDLNSTQSCGRNEVYRSAVLERLDGSREDLGSSRVISAPLF